jgi:hypothetical protein
MSGEDTSLEDIQSGYENNPNPSLGPMGQVSTELVPLSCEEIEPRKKILERIIYGVYVSPKAGVDSKALVTFPDIPRQLLLTRNIIENLLNLAPASQAASSPRIHGTDKNEEDIINEKQIRGALIGVLGHAVDGDKDPASICDDVAESLKGVGEKIDGEIVTWKTTNLAGTKQDPMLTMTRPVIDPKVAVSRGRKRSLDDVTQLQRNIQGMVVDRRSLLENVKNKLFSIFSENEDEDNPSISENFLKLVKLGFYSFVPGSVMGSAILKGAFNRGILEFNPQGSLGDPNAVAIERDMRYLSAIALYMLFVDMLDKYTSGSTRDGKEWVDIETKIYWGFNLLLSMYEEPPRKRQRVGALKKHKATKRKATKRKATKRKSTKRKATKRKATKRKATKRKSTKRK